MTRQGLHALNSICAAANARPTVHLVPDAVNGDLMVFFDHHFSTGNRRVSRQCRNKATRQICRAVAQPLPTIGRKTNSP